MATSELLMIEPVNFHFNPETAVNNRFQRASAGKVQEQALAEFQNFAELLIKNRLGVTVIQDTIDPLTPDSIFPNNWISFHEDNSIILYPMFARNRRLERKKHVLDALKAKFKISKIHDLSHHELHGAYLEGTGSMVLDRGNKIVYAATSERTDPALLREFCSISNYKPIYFTTADGTGNPIYHSNVMMCIGDSFALICMDAIINEASQDEMIRSFEETDKEIINISLEQMLQFAGNMLQVINKDGELLLVMSHQAYRSLSEFQLSKLETHGRIIHAPLETIETCGGGSARCMLAEVYNELK